MMVVKRNKRRKKCRLKPLGFLLLILILGILFLIIYTLFSTHLKLLIAKTYYIRSKENAVTLYTYDEEKQKMEKARTIYRGTPVKSRDKSKVIEDLTYTEIYLEDDSLKEEEEKKDKQPKENTSSHNYYIDKQYLTLNIKDVVLEKQKYVRTPVTVYQNEKDYKIASFIKKGNKLDILDYDKLDQKGFVNMYKIQKDDITGWVYAKYLVDSKEEALKNYNEHGTYDIHKNRHYSYELYGGKAGTLDYYPYEKEEFSDNKLLKKAKAMYLNAGVIQRIDSYLKIAKSNGVNAMVVDLKDGALAYPMEVASQYSPTAYRLAINSFDDYQRAIKKIKDAGIYVIGRIVVFNDSHYGTDHPEECITSPASHRLWPSAYSRKAWEYNIALAKQAISDMHFNEIQFDYVRFPEDSYRMSQNDKTDFKNTYHEEKAEAVQNFIFYAADQIHKYQVYLSVDVFGECSNTYVTAYGQYWPAISNIVDVISSMPYTDHFGRNYDTWTNAYHTVNTWALGAATRQKEIPTPAVARTWITAYDTPYWHPVVIYDANVISAQARALTDAGLKGGFMTWNALSSLDKYNQIQEAFAQDY